jgi:hypothetical protein
MIAMKRSRNKEDTQHAGETERDQSRKRSEEWAVLVNNWPKSHVGVLYRMTHNPTQLQAVTTLKIVGLTLDKYTERPAKKRKREIWRSIGIISTIRGK